MAQNTELRLATASMVAGIAAVALLAYAILCAFVIAALLDNATSASTLVFALATPIPFGPVAAVVAIVCGHSARRTTPRSDVARRRSVTGIALGYSYLGILVIVVGAGIMTFVLIPAPH